MGFLGILLLRGLQLRWQAMLRSISFGRVMQQEESEGQAFLTWFRRWFVLNSYIASLLFVSPRPQQPMFQNMAVHLH